MREKELTHNCHSGKVQLLEGNLTILAQVSSDTQSERERERWDNFDLQCRLVSGVVTGPNSTISSKLDKQFSQHSN